MSIENANETIVTTLNYVERKVAEFNGLLVKDNETLQDFQVQGWSILWRQLGRAFGVAKLILDASNEEAYLATLKNCGIKPAGEKSNKWLPVTKLLFGSWTDSTGTLQPWNSALNTVFETDRSAEKYAVIFKHLEVKGISEDGAFDYIKGFDHATHGKHLKGIEASERASNGSSGSISDEQAMNLGSMTDASDVYVLDAPSDLKTVAMGSTFFKIEGGKLYLFGATQMEQDAFDKRIVARGKKLYNEKKALAAKSATLDAVAELISRKAA